MTVGVVAERSTPLEFRVSGGRTLIGEAVKYGRLNPRPAPGIEARSERFEAGSIEPMYPVQLTLQHDPERRLAGTEDGTLRLRDGTDALWIEADLREGSAELDLVRRRALTGLSVEFIARLERREAGVRVLQRAAMPCVSLVDIGSHETSVELRAAEARAATVIATIRSTITSGARLRCECSGPDCGYASFEPKALADMADKISSDEMVLSTWASYDRPLGANTTGRVRAEVTPQGLALAVDVPDTADGRLLLDAAETSGVVVRPYLDAAASDSVIEGTGENATRRYRSAVVRSLVVSSTDARQGWDVPVIERRTAAGRFDRRLLLL